jgi:threonine/homoserine/homoserine lactone efflux protein
MFSGSQWDGAHEMMRIFLNGLTTGLILQFALGPVFFLVVDMVLQRTLSDGFIAAAAVTIADYLYIFLAAAGAGVLLARNRARMVSGLAGGAVLMAYGLYLMLPGFIAPFRNEVVIACSPDYRASFLVAFMLTLSSPLTMVFWAALFTSKALEHGYSSSSLAFFGFSAGLATPLFLGTTVLAVSVLKASATPTAINSLHLLAGSVMTGYGIVRIAAIAGKGFSNSPGKRKG